MFSSSNKSRSEKNIRSPAQPPASTSEPDVVALGVRDTSGSDLDDLSCGLGVSDCK